MKSKTLSRVTKYVFIWVTGTIILVSTKTGMDLLLKFIPMKSITIFLAVPSFTLIILIASRIFSYFSLSINKGQPLSTILCSYQFAYVLLTDEAKQEWRNFIAKERERISKQTEANI